MHHVSQSVFLHAATVPWLCYHAARVSWLCSHAATVTWLCYHVTIVTWHRCCQPSSPDVHLVLTPMQHSTAQRSMAQDMGSIFRLFGVLQEDGYQPGWRHFSTGSCASWQVCRRQHACGAEPPALGQASRSQGWFLLDFNVSLHFASSPALSRCCTTI